MDEGIDDTFVYRRVESLVGRRGFQGLREFFDRCVVPALVEKYFAEKGGKKK